MDATRAREGREYGFGRVLLIGDDPYWLHRLSGWLHDAGFDALCSSALAGVTPLDDLRADAVMLGTTSTDEAAVALCASIRAATSAAILASPGACSGALPPRLLDAGADVVIDRVAPQRIVIARLRALLRRAPRRGKFEGAIGYGSLRLDLIRSVLHVMDHEFAVDPREQRLLEILIASQGGAATRALLAEATGSSIPEVDQLVRRLRQKIEAYEPRRQISNVRGVGYRLLR